MKRGPIHLHIDELVLHGFNPADRHQIADAVERELARLLDGAEFLPQVGTSLQIDRKDAGQIVVGDRNASLVGSEIARAVGASVSGVLNLPQSQAAVGRNR